MKSPNIKDMMAKQIATGQVGSLKLKIVNVPRVVIESNTGVKHAIDLVNGADDSGSQSRLESIASALCHPLATIVAAEYMVVDVGTRQSTRATLQASLTGCNQTTSVEGQLTAASLDRHAATLEGQSPEEAIGLPVSADKKKAERLFNWTDAATTAVEKDDTAGNGFDRRLDYDHCTFYLNSKTGAWKMVKKPSVASVYAALQGLCTPHDLTNEDLLEALAHTPQGDAADVTRRIMYPRVTNPQILNR